MYRGISNEFIEFRVFRKKKMTPGIWGVTTSDRQKSYTDLKRKDIEYEVKDTIFLKVSLWRKILQFGKRGQLSLRFIGPYEIQERIAPVAYRLALPLELSNLHDVFHVSMLRKYRSDESHILPLQEVQVK